MSVPLPSGSSEQPGQVYGSYRWGTARGPAARLLKARDGREAITAAVDLCRAELGSPTVGILLEGRQPWLTSRGVPPAVRASLSRILTTPEPTGGTLSAVGIGARVVEALRPTRVQVLEAGQAALVVGATRVEADRRLLARVAASVRDVTQTGPFDRHVDATAVRDGLLWTAHELKAPLGAVRTALDRLVSSRSARPKDLGLLRGARDEVGRLLDVVDPLLRFAAGEVDDPSSVVDLTTVVREVLDAESGRKARSRRRLTFHARGALLVRADPALLGVAVGNLVRNALTYSGDQAAVGVSLYGTEDRAIAQVWDRGPGVPSAERERVFGRSVRGRSVGTRPGQGLGLFIARRIAEMHGGTVSLVDSPRGADFRLELPLADGRSLSSAS